LILRVMELAALDSRVEGHARLLAVLLDELRDAPDTPLLLPMPADMRAGAIARHVLADPAEADDLDSLSRRFGTSRRTAERLFRAETGLSFGLWRQEGAAADVRVHAGTAVGTPQSRTYKPTNLQTYEPTNLRTYKPTNLQTEP
jgi:hypothetical protein